MKNLLTMTDHNKNNIFETLKEKAFEKYGKITACPGTTLEASLSLENGKVILWFMPENPALATSAVAYYDIATGKYYV